MGLHFTGGVNFAATQERWDFLRADWARHKVLGLSTELLSPSQLRELCPIVDTTGVLGAIYDPMEGHLDPSGATHAFAKAARTHIGCGLNVKGKIRCGDRSGEETAAPPIVSIVCECTRS